MAELPQPRDGVLDGAGLVQRVLVEVDVEIHPEVVQALPDLAEHELHPVRPEALRLRRTIERSEVDVAGGDDARRDVVDVLTAVAVLRGWLAEVGRDERASEAVDLRPVIVEVVLARDEAALGLEDASERVADRRPARAADVNRSGRVGRDELEVDRDARIQVAIAVGLPRVDDARGNDARRGGIERDVDEAGPRHRGLGDAVDLREGGDELGRELAGNPVEALAELHRDIGGPVAVLAVARALERHIRVGDLVRALPRDLAGGVQDNGSQFGGIHEGRSYPPGVACTAIR